jgi:hypothetical protein
MRQTASHRVEWELQALVNCFVSSEGSFLRSDAPIMIPKINVIASMATPRATQQTCSTVMAVSIAVSVAGGGA